jgi:hypothetical protein
MRRGLLPLVATALCSAALLAVSCRDATDPEHSGEIRPLQTTIYSAVELDSVNPMRRTGRLHNMGTRIFRTAYKRTRSVREACEAVASWAITDTSLSALLTSAERADLSSRILQSSQCQSGSVRRASVSAAQQYPHTVSSAGMALIDSIYDSMNSIPSVHARNADTLAARLSPFYTSSLSLGSQDAEAVQTVISVAQASLEDTDATFDSGSVHKFV